MPPSAVLGGPPPWGVNGGAPGAVAMNDLRGDSIELGSRSSNTVGMAVEPIMLDPSEDGPAVNDCFTANDPVRLDVLILCTMPTAAAAEAIADCSVGDIHSVSPSWLC